MIDTETDFNATLKSICALVEPTIVHIRSSGTEKSENTRKAINEALCTEQGFFTLNVTELRDQERDRRTTLGNRILHSETTGTKCGLDVYI
jgi:hypothetical protein